MTKTVVVTGGAGYVGSHAAKAFSRAGWRVVTVDNLTRGFAEAVRYGPLIPADIAESEAMAAVFNEYEPDLVAHFAAVAYVGESIAEPELYYTNNVVGTLSMLETMRRCRIDNLIFSSSCATYGVPAAALIDEDHPQKPINPYGWSKFFVEQMLCDYHVAHGLNSIALRYFNAAGCDPEGELGERHDPETHIIPLAIEAALNPTKTFTVNGVDFPTPDGSAVRDFVHVSDLARAHVLAGELLLATGGRHAVNLGTGAGTSVLEVIATVEACTGSTIRTQAGPRRPGDPPVLVAAAQKAQRQLGWRPEYSTLSEIIETALAWQVASASSAVAPAARDRLGSRR
jgi:UDP-arabinose 4-epimerase